MWPPSARTDRSCFLYVERWERQLKCLFIRGYGGQFPIRNTLLNNYPWIYKPCSSYGSFTARQDLEYPAHFIVSGCALLRNSSGGGEMEWNSHWAAILWKENNKTALKPVNVKAKILPGILVLRYEISQSWIPSTLKLKIEHSCKNNGNVDKRVVVGNICFTDWLTCI